MVNQHILDQDIQNFVLNGKTNEYISSHIFKCEVCKSQVEIYDVLNNKLKMTAPEVFSFDVAELVMRKIESKHKKEKFETYIMVVLFITVIFVFCYLSYPVIFPLLKTITILNSTSIALIVTIASSLILFTVTDMIRIQKNNLSKLS